MSIRLTLRSSVSSLGLFTVVACSAGTGGQSQGNGGNTASGGALQGGAPNHGGSANGGTSVANGGSANGGSSAVNGGSANGGSSAVNGGSANGGSASGGSVSGGAAQGGSGAGASNGGSSSGGSATGGAASGGSGTAGSSASGCAKSGLLFCDDFEKYSAGPAPTSAPWSTSFIGPDTPSIVVDGATPAHSGTRSVVVHAPNTNFQSFLIYHDAAVLPRTQGDFYLRVFVRLGRDMATHHNAYIVLDRFASPGAGSAVRLGEDAGMLSLTVGGDAQGTLSNAKFSQDQILGPHFVSKTWACLEGYFNSTKPEIDFWLDGVEIPDFHHTNWTADAYDSVRLGFEKYAGPELDIWFDDFAIGATRVGCN